MIVKYWNNLSRAVVNSPWPVVFGKGAEVFLKMMLLVILGK